MPGTGEAEMNRSELATSGSGQAINNYGPTVVMFYILSVPHTSHKSKLFSLI